ncbi:MAG TPA: LLM class F420-dependent oxidoreductase [Candidatus Binatia bacterium]|nr:LLM class F420-dependent oxidoreductase [Candidatus Binatia bacterium]
MDLGRVGLWHFLDVFPAATACTAAREIEQLGFKALWIPEALGREVFTHAGLLLGATERLIVATGIANVWARDAMAMAAAQKTLAEAYPGRFLLGMGVSHAPLVAGMRGHDYKRPLTYLRGYLDAMDSAPYMAAPPAEPPPRVLASLHPRSLELARERAWGSHPYLVPPEHTARARRVLGAGKLLAPEQMVCLERDASTARAIARQALQVYLGLPNYVRNLLALGFTAADVANGGSDRLVDAIVAWGDIDTIAARVKAHHDAGADHVCLQVLRASPNELPRAEWRDLAATVLRR